MSIIFCGDLVLPYHTNVDYNAILPFFKIIEQLLTSKAPF